MIDIGHIQVNLSLREIRIDGRLASIGSRAFDILEMLVRAEGALVSKDDILKKVWPETIVEENNLQVHISALRKLFGDRRDLIKTIPGRGYRMVGESVGNQAPVPVFERSGQRVVDAAVNNLPAAASLLIGREQALDALSAALHVSRHVTIVAAGGMGKTRLAIEAARGMADRFPDGIFLLRLAGATDEQTVLDEFVKVIGAKRRTGAEFLRQLSKSFLNKQALFVLDNCEHVLPAAATLTDALLQENGSVRVLATSRESLRTGDETLYRLAPLIIADPGAEERELRESSAVALFLMRARASVPDFAPAPDHVALIASICRRLDGMPLAIELAAARAVVLGIGEVFQDLGDRFRTLTGGHRTALPRHQTLKATLDWSHDLLNDAERRVLRRAGIFVSGFTLDGAKSVACEPGLDGAAVVIAVAGLAAKSLLVVTPTDQATRYSMLETTRAYALQKLDDNGERRRIASLHATFMTGLVNAAEGNKNRFASRDPFPLLEGELANIRAALTWAFSARGDEQIGITLAAACAHLFFDGSMMAECAEWARLALHAIRRSSDAHSSVRTSTQLGLITALAAALVYTEGPTAETNGLWAEARTLSRLLNEGDFEARAIWGLWNAAQYGGQSRDALGYAQEFLALADTTDQIANRVLGQRLLGISLHFAGDQPAARRHLEAMLSQYDNSRHQLRLFGFTIDHRVVGQATLARVLWLQGQTGQALEMAATSLRSTRSPGNDLVRAYVLVEASIPLHLLAGQVQEARRHNAALKELASRAGLRIWELASDCFDALFDVVDDASLDRLAAFGSALNDMAAAGFLAHRTFFLGYYAQGLAKGGLRDRALAQIDLALQIGQESGEQWYYSEAWRIKSEILSMSTDEDTTATDTTIPEAMMGVVESPV